VAISSIAFSNTSAIDAYTSQSRSNDSRQASTNSQQSSQSSSITKFSANGIVRSTLEDIQAKAQALRNLSQSPNLQDFKVAVQGVVSSINSIRQSVAAAEADRSAKQAAENINQSVFGDQESSSSLQKSGLGRQDDGTLTLDQNKLSAAFQNDQQGTLNTFSQLASRVEESAGKQTQPNDSNDKKTSNLSQNLNASQNERASDETRQNAQRLAQQLASQQALASGYSARNAVTSYFTVSTL